MEKAKKPPPTIHELFPTLPEDRLKDIEDTLYRYCEIVLRIADRLEGEEQARVDVSGKPT
jgi:hypothetical protein